MGGSVEYDMAHGSTRSGALPFPSHANSNSGNSLSPSAYLRAYYGIKLSHIFLSLPILFMRVTRRVR
jgi:hypothetical protein